jgi:hypothetical protein
VLHLSFAAIVVDGHGAPRTIFRTGYLRDGRDNSHHGNFADQTEHLPPVGVVPSTRTGFGLVLLAFGVARVMVVAPSRKLTKLVWTHLFRRLVGRFSGSGLRHLRCIEESDAHVYGLVHEMDYLVLVVNHRVREAPAHSHAAKSEGGHSRLLLPSLRVCIKSPFDDETTHCGPYIFRAMLSFQYAHTWIGTAISCGCPHRPSLRRIPNVYFDRNYHCARYTEGGTPTEFLKTVAKCR